VEGVNLGPFAMTASFESIRIVDSANPARYLVRAGPGNFDVNGLQLFGRKLVVEVLTAGANQPQLLDR
jgi:hypothetical protein